MDRCNQLLTPQWMLKNKRESAIVNDLEYQYISICKPSDVPNMTLMCPLTA